MHHRRKEQIRASRNGTVDRQRIYTRDKGVCRICDQTVGRDEFVLDHRKPLKYGGAHTAANLRIAHARCNSARGAPEFWWRP